MEHILRMELELQELEERKEKLITFYEREKEKPKFTNETQRIYLAIQYEHMDNYSKILRERIEYEKELHNFKPCYEAGDGSYDQAVGKCFK